MSNFTEGFKTGIKGTGSNAKGLGQALGSSIGGIGTAVGSLAGNLIGGEMESQAGNIINTLGNIGGMIPGPWGAAIGGGLKLAGGLVNAAFGTKTDQDKLNAANEGTNVLRSFTSTASSFDDVLGPQAVASVQDPYKGGWFAKKRANNKNDALKAERAFAQNYADMSVTNNVSNIASTQSDNILANFAAFGGPLGFGSGAIRYEMANQYNLAKNAAAIRQGNNLVSIPNSFQGLETFAFGGELNTHGADFTNGIIYINNGGTHESNPYKGVPMGLDSQGVPNLLEEGEVVWKDYVFSNRLKVPKAVREKYKLKGSKDMTFANAVKYAQKESEERPNDPISIRGLDSLLSNLAMEQEQIRTRPLKNKDNVFDDGGYIDFMKYLYSTGNPDNWAGVTSKDFTSHPLYEGYTQSLIYAPKSTVPVSTTGNQKPVEEKTSIQPPKKLPTYLRYTPAVGLGLATLTDAIGWTNKPDYSNADALINAGKAAMTPQQIKWNPLGTYITYNPFDRNYYSNQLAASSGAARRNILNTSGGNRGQALAGLIATDYNTGIQLGNLARQAEEYNLAQRHQVGTFNRGTNQANSEGFLKAAIANQEAQARANALGLEAQMAAYQMREKSKAIADEAKSSNMSGFLTSLGNIGKENQAINMLNFAIQTGQHGKISDGLLKYIIP